MQLSKSAGLRNVGGPLSFLHWFEILLAGTRLQRPVKPVWIKKKVGGGGEEDRLENAGELIKNPIVACLTSENAAGCGCSSSQTGCLSSLFPTEPMKDSCLIESHTLSVDQSFNNNHNNSNNNNNNNNHHHHHHHHHHH
jgi:hypothetical protein